MVLRAWTHKACTCARGVRARAHVGHRRCCHSLPVATGPASPMRTQAPHNHPRTCPPIATLPSAHGLPHLSLPWGRPRGYIAAVLKPPLGRPRGYIAAVFKPPLGPPSRLDCGIVQTTLGPPRGQIAAVFKPGPPSRQHCGGIQAKLGPPSRLDSAGVIQATLGPHLRLDGDNIQATLGPPSRLERAGLGRAARLRLWSSRPGPPLRLGRLRGHGGGVVQATLGPPSRPDCGGTQTTSNKSS